MTSSRTLLILSFSPIRGDARVLKQVRHFSATHTVTTCGFGPAPDGVASHIQIPDDVGPLAPYGRHITLRLYGRAYWGIGAVDFARRHLVRGAYDAVLANDVETVPVALGLAPAHGVHADLHEYSPRLHEENPAWKRRIKPFYDWLCRRYVARARSWTTVSGGLAREYASEFGFVPEIVTNAAPFAQLEPREVGDRVRLVHSGACLRNRVLMTLIEAVELADTDVDLDLYLTPNDPGYLAELREYAARVPGVTVREPVPYEHLIDTLNGYDLGVHVLPPTNFNNEWALPNKLFDYVQARLGVIVGPSAEMAAYVSEHRLGSVTSDFSAESLAAVLRTLVRGDVQAAKSSAHAAAHDLSAESQVRTWGLAIDALWKTGSK